MHRVINRDSKSKEEKKTVLAERAGAICPYGFMKGSYELVAATFDGRVGDLRKYCGTWLVAAPRAGVTGRLFNAGTKCVPFQGCRGMLVVFRGL